MHDSVFMFTVKTSSKLINKEISEISLIENILKIVTFLVLEEFPLTARDIIVCMCCAGKFDAVASRHFSLLNDIENNTIFCIL